jgi:hypothetical protein
MEKFVLKPDLNSNKFELSIGQHKLNFVILDAPINSCIGSISQAIAYKIEEDYHVALYADDDTFNILYTQENPKVRTINILIKNINKFDYQKNKAIAILGENQISIDVQDGTIVGYDKNILTITTSSPDTRLEFKYKTETDFNSLNYFQPLTVDSNVFVPLGNRGPEFSIGIFDKVWSHPRPIRFGVPVISTVPAHGSGLTQEEQYYYDLGKGPKSKLIYFRVVCSQELSDDLPVKLLIYQSNGLDTITQPIAISLTKISVSGPSVYSGNHTFYEEDTVAYVDGYIYFTVYIDIIQQASLTIKADDTAGNFVTRSDNELKF